MTDIDFDPEEIGPLPPGLRTAAAALREATSLRPPDTGATTTATAGGLQTIITEAARLARDLDRLAERIERCIDVYAGADDAAGLWHQALMVGAMA